MVDFLTKKEEFKEFYASNYTTLLNAEKSFRNLIHLLLSNSQDITSPKVSSRLKDRNECIEKFNLKYRKKIEEEKKDYEIKNYITDLLGIRVICLYESDIELVVDVLRDNFKLLDMTNKTKQLLKKKDSFGYKGVHLDLKLDTDRRKLPEYNGFSNFQFEVQVRSIVQDAWSEIDHKLKYKKSLSEQLQRRVTTLAGLFEMADREFDSIRLETLKEVEEKIKQKDLKLNQILTPFILFNFMNENFPAYSFEDYKIEGFLYEILELKAIAFGDLKKAFDNHKETIIRYKEYREDYFGDRFNPFTFIRHTLYLNNSRIFKSLLFDLQRDNFDNWIVNN